LIASFQNDTSPMRAIISRMKSASPTDTPPLVMMTSAASEASRKAASSAAGSSGTTPMSSRSQPRRDSAPNSV